MGEYSVKRATAGSKLTEDIILFRMQKARPPRGMTEIYQRRVFARCLAQTTQALNIAFAWPSPDDDEQALLTAFDAWIEMPRDELDRWLDALNAVDAPGNDPDLLPTVPDDVKKTAKAPKSDAPSG